jgi:hypothetical protein
MKRLVEYLMHRVLTLLKKWLSKMGLRDTFFPTDRNAVSSIAQKRYGTGKTVWGPGIAMRADLSCFKSQDF